LDTKQPLGKLELKTSRVRALVLLALLLWLIFGILGLLVAIPYIGYHKIVRSRKLDTTHHASYFLSKAAQGHEKRRCDLVGWLLFVVLVILTPLILPFAYLSGFILLIYTLCCSQKKQKLKKHDKVHTEASLN